MGMEQEAEQATKLMVWLTTRTVASSNNTPEESKKAERSTISINLLLVVYVEAIWIDQRSKNDSEKSLVVERQSQNTLSASQKSGSNISVPAKFRRMWRCKSIDSSWRANELALDLVLDMSLRHAQRVNWGHLVTTTLVFPLPRPTFTLILKLKWRYLVNNDYRVYANKTQNLISTRKFTF